MSDQWPAGKTFGQLTPAQKAAAIRHAADQLQAELTAGADAISAVLDQPLPGETFEGIAIEKIYVAADAIELALETKPVGTWWTISKIARKAGLANQEAGTALRWMLREKYIVSNGRGGCWVNYSRKH